MTDTIVAIARGAYLRPELRPEAMHGVLGEIVTELAKTTDADPAAMLVQLMTLFGNAVGSEPHSIFGGADHPGRLFCMVVGDAAEGRKGTSLGQVMKLMAEADPVWAQTRVFSGLQSPEAVVDRTAEKDGVQHDGRMMILETEAARIAPKMTQFSDLLRRAWEDGTLALDTRKKSVRASAHVSLIMHITPEELRRKRDQFRLAGGLESRILFCYCARQPKKVSRFAKPVDFSGLAEKLRTALVRAKVATLMGLDPVSQELCRIQRISLATEYRMAEEVYDNEEAVFGDVYVGGRSLGAMFDRCDPQVIRLALIFAAADCAPEIGVDHITAAKAVWEYCGRSAELILGDDLYALAAKPAGKTADTVSAERVGRLFQYLVSAGGWVVEGEITKGLFSDNLAGGDFPEWDKDGNLVKPGTREVDALVAALLAKGLKIECSHRRLPGDGSKGGPTPTRYRLVPYSG